MPLSIKSARNKICNLEDSAGEDSQVKGYKIADRTREYANIKQRWLAVDSEIRKEAAPKKIASSSREIVKISKNLTA
ncbi:hypothetical protein QUA81_28100 [Microcoleus sp. F6_B4]